MLDRSVLVLNKSFQPVHITTGRRAFCLLAKGLVRAVDSEVRTYSLDEWMTLTPGSGDDTVATPSRRLIVPHTVALTVYDRLPRRHVKFSRRNVFLRDRHTCQYCGEHFPSERLNLDHVVPASRGGPSTWENVVASCIRCNSHKRNRSPAEAGLRLLRPPVRPHWQAFLPLGINENIQQSWKLFLGSIMR